MSGRSRSAEVGQGGYVSVYFALIASLVLVPLVMLLIDVMTLSYARTKLQSTLDAVAIASVAETRNWHIPIPTDWAGWIPYNGWLINGLHLKNLSTSVGLWRRGGKSELEPKLRELAALNGDKVGPEVTIVPGKAQVLPLGNFVSPFMYVEIPAEATVKLQTPFLARALGKQGVSKGEVKLQAKSCAVAWYRVDRWAHRWWGGRTASKKKDDVIATLDAIFNLTDEPVKYYRLVNCVDGGAKAISLAESVITEHLNLQREEGVREYADPWDYLTRSGMGGAETVLKEEWGGDSGGRQIKKAKETLQKPKDLPDACKPGDPCLEKGQTGDWVDKAESDKEAEEKAEKAAKKAAEAAAQSGKGLQKDEPGEAGAN